MEQAMRGRFWCGACLEKHSIVFQQIIADFLCGWRWWRSDTFVSYDSLMRSSLTTHCHVILQILLLWRFLCKFHGFQKVLCLLWWINHFDKSQHQFAKFKDCSLEDFTFSAQLLVFPNCRADLSISWRFLTIMQDAEAGLTSKQIKRSKSIA